MIRTTALAVLFATSFIAHASEEAKPAKADPAKGKVIAEGILGETERYRLFEPFGLVWAGGIAGLAVAQLTYWKLQAQDWWRERAA